jgi:hypothetical protein
VRVLEKKKGGGEVKEEEKKKEKLIADANGPLAPFFYMKITNREG